MAVGMNDIKKCTTTKWTALVGVSVMCLATTAWAGASYILTGSATLTQYSGKSPGFWEALTPGSGDYQAAYEITMWEHQNEPCRVKVRTRHVNTYSGRSAEWKDCYGSASGSAAKTISFTQEDTYINGVQVCHNNAGTRIKGVKIFGKKLNRNTGALSDAGSKKFERPNCKNWKPVRYCPAGKVADGIRVTTVGRDASGIALSCRTLAEK